MVEFTTVATPAGAAPPRIRRIGEGDLNWALSEGWKDFRERRGDILLLALIYPVVGFLAAAVALDKAFLPFFFPAAAGLSILGPAVASGFYELARRREAGLDSSWIHFVDPLRGRGRGTLAILTAGLLVLFVAWLGVAAGIYAATLGASGPLDPATFLDSLFTTPQGWAMIVAGNLAGLVFAIVTAVLSLVSFPLIVDRPVDPVTAVMTSIRAVRENPGVSVSWGLRVAGLLVLGAIPLFLGLAIVLPVLGYATWHLYTRLVER